MQSLVEDVIKSHPPLKSQLLKWVGNKQKFAAEIVSYFPAQYNRYYEPFLGSGAILATLAPNKGLGSDTFEPLMQIWKKLKEDPEELIDWYAERRNRIGIKSKQEVYKEVLASYNLFPNGADFLFLTRSCYGGVIRFRKVDGYMSTPCGVHDPISVDGFSKRVKEWGRRLRTVDFECFDYKNAFADAKSNDLIYCDPPYSHSQAILYGAQNFRLEDLLEQIEIAKSRGVHVVLSIDGHKKSGNLLCDLPIQSGLFKNEVYVNCGRSMLRRFQLEGRTLEDENVSDRLLMSY